MTINWTQVIATVGGGLILALQGVNLTQGVAISGQEKRIETLEEDLGKANLALNKQIAANQEEFRAYWTSASKKIDQILDKVNQAPAPATH